MNKIDKVILYSNKVSLVETSESHDSSIAKIVLCDFNVNKNGVKLNRETIKKWSSTLLNKPLVGKIEINQDNKADFSGHNLVEVEKIDQWNNKYYDYEFDTSAFGVFISENIETIDGIECWVATAQIWKRFYNAHNIIMDRIKSGTLYTSWELSILNSRYDENSVKVIDDAVFLGHCLLAKTVEPAYDSSRVLNVAEKINENPRQDSELTQALLKDLIEISSQNIQISKEQEEQSLKKEVNKTIENSETKDIAEDTKEVKVVEEVISENKEEKIDEKEDDEKDNEKSELEKVQSTVSELSANLILKNEALIKANETIQTLKEEISNLKSYKEKFDQSEKEKIELENSTKREELKSKLLKTKLFKETEFSEDENLKTLIATLDQVKLDSIIAERVMKSLENVEIETSEVKKEEKITSNLNDDDGTITNKGSLFFKAVISN